MKRVSYLVLIMPFFMLAQPYENNSTQGAYNAQDLNSLDPALRNQILTLMQQAQNIGHQQPSPQQAQQQQSNSERNKKPIDEKKDKEQQLFLSISTAVVGKFLQAMITEDPMPLVDAFGTALTLIAQRRQIKLDQEDEAEVLQSSHDSIDTTIISPSEQ